MTESAAALPRPWRGRTGWIRLLGPAFVASVAYVDPGNFATNVQGGARFGFLLLWVVVAANLVGMLLQYLSAKLGVATGMSLAEICRERYPRPVVWGLWVQGEIVAIMTDLAEFVGGAVALSLLFGWPLPSGGVVIAVASLLLLMTRERGRWFEGAVVALLAVVLLAFLYQTLRAQAPLGDVASGLVPRFAGRESVLLGSGIIGATVMPHALYLHSALTSERRPDRDRETVLRAHRFDVLIAMGVAGAVNVAVLVSAGALFHDGSGGGAATGTLQGAYSRYAEAAGSVAAAAFAVALLAAGLASSSVGVYAGEVIMQGFLRRRIPRIVRRLVVTVPALVVLALTHDPTRALVLSQVALSFGIPFALIPLVLATRRRDLMGAWVNRPVTTVAAGMAAAVIVGLNIILLTLA
ncbi:Nramp family divalent metal transporter [Actinoallomurus bryophytorum]|uniref:Manganese transport protein n=1 Tax=Actinoallomurus bryophytorum TaxID=1490222 RepID=A0A543C1N6_9ACTN|nr:Nramp family divalent metal transporter [Actinoallomurus bryophytorum]TQL90987.1 manganese transport protein [Actinoallomurus bryophytorum]